MEKTRMVWLPDGRKCLKICLFISTKYTNVTERWTVRRTDRHHMTALTALVHSIVQQKLNAYSQSLRIVEAPSSTLLLIKKNDGG